MLVLAKWRISGDPMRYAALSAVFLLLFDATAAQGQSGDRCADVLRDGSFDYFEARDDREFMQAWNRFARTTSVSDRNRRSSTRIAGQDGIAGGSGSHDDHESARKLDDSINSDTGNQQEFTRRVRIARLASTAIVNAWRDCMQGPGLRVSLRRSVDPLRFWIVARYDSSVVGEDYAYIDIVSDTPGILKCGGRVQTRVRVTRTELAISCTRTQDRDVSLHIDTGPYILAFGLTTFSLPKSPSRPVSPPPVPCWEKIVGVFRCQGAGCGSGYARVDFRDGKSLFYNERGHPVQEGKFSHDGRTISLPAYGDGQVNADCNTIVWGSGSVWVRERGPDWVR